MRKRLSITIAIVVVLITVTVAFAYGKVAGSSDAANKDAVERMSEFDWSKTCPAAGCRNHNEE